MLLRLFQAQEHFERTIGQTDFAFGQNPFPFSIKQDRSRFIQGNQLEGRCLCARSFLLAIGLLRGRRRTALTLVLRAVCRMADMCQENRKYTRSVKETVPVHVLTFRRGITQTVYSLCWSTGFSLRPQPLRYLLASRVPRLIVQSNLKVK